MNASTDIVLAPGQDTPVELARRKGNFSTSAEWSSVVTPHCMYPNQPIEVHVMNQLPELLTPKEAAIALRVVPRTITNFLARGVLEKVTLSKRCIRIPRESVLRAMAVTKHGGEK